MPDDRSDENPELTSRLQAFVQEWHAKAKEGRRFILELTDDTASHVLNLTGFFAGATEMNPHAGATKKGCGVCAKTYAQLREQL